MSQEREGEQQSRRDFFISYTGRDRQWAEWIAWQLEEAGYTLFLQAWDVRPGSNTVAEMENALKSAERTLLVLSSAYLQSDDTFAQWAVPFRADPGGAHRSLLPVCIEPCEVKGLLGPIGCIDLISLEEGQARERLLEGAKAERAKPTTVAFPLHTIPPVAFPGSVPWLWNVPYLRNPHFTGRDEVLITLSEHLALVAHDDQRQVRPVALTQRQAITGLGGIGKTQIAVEYAYRSRDLGHYTHTCWVNAASEETIIASFVSIAQLLPCLSAHDETDQRKQVEAVKHWLEQCQEPWLLIFDNADEVALVGNYLPHQGNGSVLLTTRAHAVGGLATSVEVETMGLVEGTHLLLRRAQRFEHASDEEVNLAGNIVVALDHFPLALDQAGAYIEETGCSFVDYLALYQTHRKALLAQRGEQVVNYPDSVATTW
ncbi:MAG TPA: TIR domain-containing protein, partial [Ktedonobacteraceae bacterium]|nr:TIR domain-containing protein [Ktedonobacteraceae bacterium]